MVFNWMSIVQSLNSDYTKDNKVTHKRLKTIDKSIYMD
jgi:hypothetical protein